jgi:hypothetical protein
MPDERDPPENPAPGQPVIRPALARGDAVGLARRLETTGSRARPQPSDLLVTETSGPPARPPDDPRRETGAPPPRPADDFSKEASGLRARPNDFSTEMSGLRARPNDFSTETSGLRARPDDFSTETSGLRARPDDIKATAPAPKAPRPRGRSGLQAIPFSAAAAPAALEGSLPSTRPSFDESSGPSRRSPRPAFDEPSGVGQRGVESSLPRTRPAFDEPSGVGQRGVESSLPRTRPAFDEPSALRRRPIAEPLDPPVAPESSLPRTRPAFDEPSALRRRPVRESLDPALPAAQASTTKRDETATPVGSDVLLQTLFKEESKSDSVVPPPPTKAELERRRRRRQDLLPIVGLVIGLIGVVLVGPSESVEVPADEARVMTQVWLSSGAASSGLRPATESPVAAAVDRIARSLHAGLVGLPVPPELHGVVVAGGAGPMSLALPDGTVVVNEALLRVARSEAELAAVFAHGLAHVIRGDVARQLTPSLPAVREALGSGAQAAAAALLTTALSTMPAIDDELEVDRLALRILRSAGYNQRYYGQALTHALLPTPSPWATLHGFNEARITSMKQLDENGRSGKAEYERDVRTTLGP